MEISWEKKFWMANHILIVFWVNLVICVWWCKLYIMSPLDLGKRLEAEFNDKITCFGSWAWINFVLVTLFFYLCVMYFVNLIGLDLICVNYGFLNIQLRDLSVRFYKWCWKTCFCECVAKVDIFVKHRIITLRYKNLTLMLHHP